MTETTDQTVRPRSVAPLKNVTALVTLIETLTSRRDGLPGLGVGSGPSGYGKTIAAQYCQNSFSAIYIECRHHWTAKGFCEALLIELGVARPKGTISRMMTEICNRVGDEPGRALIIDEADKLVDKHNIELVRDIYETTQAPVVLVGEELLPQKLEEYERVHNRVLDWVLFQPCDLDDTRALAALLAPQVAIGDDLLELIRKKTEGRARRIAVTLHEAASYAKLQGVLTLDAASYGGRIFTSEVPKRTSRAA